MERGRGREMSIDLVLKPTCECCGSSSDLYGSTCKHSTLCINCGKSMAQNRTRCRLCGTPVTKLIREYTVRASSNTDKSFSICRFITGLPPFSKKKSENKWSLHKEGLQGRQLTDALREKYKNKPWILEDETGLNQFQGQMEGTQAAKYYLLMLQGREFVAYPAGSWYNFNKVAQYKQLTLEEAEEKMSKRKNNATGYERWMMKVATNGPAAFGEARRIESMDSGVDVGRSKKGKSNGEEDPANKGEEDEETEETRKNRLRLNRKDFDDDEDNTKGGDDLDDDDIEKGDDWEHEDIFTDDDEAVGNNPEEREDLAPEIPAPPEIKQDDEDEGEGEGEGEEGGGLSKSGKELKKLLGKANGLNESDDDDDDDDDDNDNDADDELGTSPVLVPKRKDGLKAASIDSSPLKSASAGGSKSTLQSASKSTKGKRKPGSDDGKASKASPSKRAKKENDTAPSPAKAETPSKASVTTKSPSSTPSKGGATASHTPITEGEIRNALLVMAPVTTQDLVAKFKARLKCQEDKSTFADILRRISRIQKTNGHSYVVLREK